MAKKWNIHRPASPSSKRDGRPTPGRRHVKPNDCQPSRGRWVFHDSSTPNPPEGTGWHRDDDPPTRATAFRAPVGGRWTCDYGCKSFVWTRDPDPAQFHAWDCPYWNNEGKGLTPF